MTDYKPVDCSTYGQYELAILHRRVLLMGWRDEDGLTHVALAHPRDLETRQGEEFLVAETTQGEPLRVRLDRIIRARPVAD